MPYKNKKDAQTHHIEYYAKNKAKYAENGKKRLEAGRKFIRKLKENSKCVDCGEDRWQCLDFDHIDPTKKTMAISQMVRARYSVKRLKKEVANCEIRCSNCHRVKTWNDRVVEGTVCDTI